MKILIVTSKYLPAIGGLESAVRNITLRLNRAGHEVVIFTNRHQKELPSLERFDGISIRRFFFVDTWPRPINAWIWFKYLVRLVLVPWTLAEFLAAIKTFHPDIVHFHYVGSPTFYVLLAKKFLEFPLITSLHGADVEQYEAKSICEKRRLCKALNQSDYVTANAQHLLEEAMAKIQINLSQKSAIIPMGFSWEEFDGIAAYQHPRDYIFTAGRFVHKKGFDVLIKAFSQLVQRGIFSGDLILAGDGEERRACRQLVGQLAIQDRVVFLGAIDGAKTAFYMKGCELFVMPSRLEAFGITLLEALYAGKKIVASKVGGLVELMEDNPNYLVPPDNPDALMIKISEALNGLSWRWVDKDKLKAKFNWEQTAESYLAIYQYMRSRKTP